MARLFADPPHEVAAFTDATVLIEPNAPSSAHAVVELWERVVPFGVPPGDYVHVGSFDQDASHQRNNIAEGDIYQARLFRDNNGSPSGTGQILGKVDMPSLQPELRTDFLTSCTEGEPQIKVTAGGTFASFVVATSARTCVRVQVASEPPEVDGDGLPFFPSHSHVATGISLTPDFVHDVVVVDELLESDTHGHQSLEAGQELFFILLAWTETAWDYVWGTKAAAPGSPSPNFELITTKTRTVSAKLALLRCIDDSDDLSDGEATFTFTLTEPGFSNTESLVWDPMPTGGIRPTNMTIVANNAGRSLFVDIKCVEDDSPAANDIAATSFRIIAPIGRGTEDVPKAFATLHSSPLTVDNDLRFQAEITYTIEYS